MKDIPKAVPAEVKIQPKTQEVSSAGKPRSAVQVGAFGTRQGAESVKRDVEKRTSYQAKIAPSTSGRLFLIVVGSYADRDSALKVRDDLRRNFGFSDCFVTGLK